MTPQAQGVVELRISQGGEWCRIWPGAINCQKAISHNEGSNGIKMRIWPNQPYIGGGLNFYTRYYKRQKAKGSKQEKKPPVTESNSLKPPQDSSFKKPHHKKNNKGKKAQGSKDKPHSSLLNKEKKELVLKRRGGLKKAHAPIVVESTPFTNASSNLRTSLCHKEAYLQKREKPESEL
ncbi:hypothetical protein O181_018744 [Austropuccinia psidii MF-1]|uniref:Uncharacterized protein n=1 Tax=Austropuccinia psidii MF-1 TaxID=1389203 RepID=A0A9Q3C895_9BASI|nr:hypothetical protein [Austropuccinia psidii MF-1]